jgi:hypothetical protein
MTILVRQACSVLHTDFKNADSLLAVKNNQPQMHAAVADFFALARAIDFAALAVSIDEEVDARYERREMCRC